MLVFNGRPLARSKCFHYPYFIFLSFSYISLLHYSPYKLKVLPTHDASKVRASGPGLNTTGVPASLPVEFTIDAKDAGEGLLAVQITVSARNFLNCTRCKMVG